MNVWERGFKNVHFTWHTHLNFCCQLPVREIVIIYDGYLITKLSNATRDKIVSKIVYSARNCQHKVIWQLSAPEISCRDRHYATPIILVPHFPPLHSWPSRIFRSRIFSRPCLCSRSTDISDLPKSDCLLSAWAALDCASLQLQFSSGVTVWQTACVEAGGGYIVHSL